MADKWIDGFRNGGVYYDRDAKELVKVTNGTCTLDHSSPDAFRATHVDGGCIYTPSEAIALRPLAVTGKRPRFRVAWTYRGVRASALSALNEAKNAEEFEKMLAAATVGRV